MRTSQDRPGADLCPTGQEIPADEAKAIEEAPQQRGGAANEPEAVTVMRDAIADPVDPLTVE